MYIRYYRIGDLIDDALHRNDDCFESLYYIIKVYIMMVTR